MSYPERGAAGGFGERSQEPFETPMGPQDIPTETEAFLRWCTNIDRHLPYRYELSNGKVSRTMINVSKAHWRVTANILRGLFQMLDRTRFEAGPTELGVRTGLGVRYPDVIVDRASSRVDGLMACEAPVLLVEVLSSSTERLDLTIKLQDYKAIDTLQVYLVCSQDEPRAWVWQRALDGAWPELPTELTGWDGKIALGALDIELAMSAIFLDIPDPPSISALMPD